MGRLLLHTYKLTTCAEVFVAERAQCFIVSYLQTESGEKRQIQLLDVIGWVWPLPSNSGK